MIAAKAEQIVRNELWLTLRGFSRGLAHWGCDGDIWVHSEQVDGPNGKVLNITTQCSNCSKIT